MRAKHATNGTVLVELSQDEAHTLMALVQNPPPDEDEWLERIAYDGFCSALFHTLRPLFPTNTPPPEPALDDDIPF